LGVDCILYCSARMVARARKKYSVSGCKINQRCQTFVLKSGI
jgi:hypothetical protein